MKAIEVKNLYKRYPHVTAVCNISFDVEKGEIFGFLGPNGAGKSTTVNMLCTLVKPNKGKIVINGMDPFKNSSEVRKKIGIVFQEQILDKNLTVYENLYLHAKLYDVPKKIFLNRLQETLKLLDIEDKKNYYVKSLSGGTRRRVEIARVMLHRPEIVFLDEPTVGLDAQTKNKIWDYLLKIRERFNTTIFLTTQYINEADICDRIGIIDYGELIALETPETLKKEVSSDLIYIDTIDNKESFVILKQEFSDFSINIKNNKIIINVLEADKFLPSLFKVLGDKIISLDLKKPTLEDVFLKLTGKSIKK